MVLCRLKLLLLLLLGSAALGIASTVPRDLPHGGGGGSLALLPRSKGDGDDDGDGDHGGGGGAEAAHQEEGAGGGGGGIEEVGGGGGGEEAGVPGSLVLAHGVMGCLAFALVFPTGGIVIRALRSRVTLWVHAGWQLTGLALAVATLGTGVYKALDEGYLSGPGLKYHTVVGLVAICGVLLQPATGWVHHVLFRRAGGRTAWSYAHIAWGVAMITLGAVNGAFGLVLEDRETKYIVVYGVLAGAVWAVWMAVSAFAQLARRRGRAAAKAADEGNLNTSRSTGGSQERMRANEKLDREHAS